MQHLGRLLVSASLFVSVAGCGDDDAIGTGGSGSGSSAAGDTAASSSTGPAPTGVLCDEAGVAECRVDQQACNLDAGGAAFCFACERGELVDKAGSCATIPGQALTHAFSEFTTEAGQEVKGLCQSWTLGNDTDLYVNAVELWQDEASHHSNWTFVPEDDFEGPDGVWPCDDRGYDQLAAAVAGGVLYAQSTQAAREVQKFTDGAVVRIPARSRIIGDVHILNVGTEPITGHLELSLFTLDPSEVRVVLAPFHLTYDGLDIPPRSRSRFEGSCSTDELRSGDEPLTMKVHYVLPHTHAQGRRFFFGPTGGDSAPGLLFDVTGFNGEARGQAYDPPIEVGGADALYFGCEFENPRDESIGWGFGDQEMCEMLGFAEADFAFESRVSTAESAGTADGMPVFDGPCDTIRIPWDAKL
jgi:hypothetical protein